MMMRTCRTLIKTSMSKSQTSSWEVQTRKTNVRRAKAELCLMGSELPKTLCKLRSTLAAVLLTTSEKHLKPSKVTKIEQDKLMADSSLSFGPEYLRSTAVKIKTSKLITSSRTTKVSRRNLLKKMIPWNLLILSSLIQETLKVPTRI